MSELVKFLEEYATYVIVFFLFFVLPALGTLGAMLERQLAAQRKFKLEIARLQLRIEQARVQTPAPRPAAVPKEVPMDENLYQRGYSGNQVFEGEE